MNKLVLDGAVAIDYLEITGSVSLEDVHLSGMVTSNYEDISGEVYASNGGDSPYTGDYSVIPKAHKETILETKGLTMTDNVVVLKIPYYETSNVRDGYTVYIGSEV